MFLRDCMYQANTGLLTLQRPPHGCVCTDVICFSLCIGIFARFITSSSPSRRTTPHIGTRAPQPQQQAVVQIDDAKKLSSKEWGMEGCLIMYLPSSTKSLNLRHNFRHIFVSRPSNQFRQLFTVCFHRVTSS